MSPVRNAPMTRFRFVTSPARAATTLLVTSAVVGWPLAVIHGWARWPVFGIWAGVLLAVLILFAVAARARTKPRPRRPTR